MKRKLIFLTVISLALFSCSTTLKKIEVDQMDLSSMTTGWRKVNAGKTVEGNPLTIAGKVFEKGIGTHAVSKYMILLDSRASEFSTGVGVDDESGKDATVEFFVMGDKKILWQSGVMHKGDSMAEIKIKLKNIRKLALYVSDGGDNINYDHADWVNPVITYKGAVPEPVVYKDETFSILTPAVSEFPRINGSKVTGATPGHPFIYRVAVTGLKPVKVSVEELPPTLTFNSETRVISGTAPAAGDYFVKISANNSLGETVSTLKISTGKGLALTPPLGWNSWNCWGLSVDQDKVKAAADAMVSSGLADHGWTYINIDDGWEAPARSASGELSANEKFPDMKSLGDYVHGYGLKLGIYSSPGPQTCGGFLGSYKHELQDVMTWQKWGIDYIKYDWCSYGQIEPKPDLAGMQKPYKLMREMLDKSNRDIVFSLCQYGMGDVWKWGEEIGGNLWRTTGDITDTWSSMSRIGFSQDKASSYAGPGHWNDPDMLVIGKVGWGPSLHPSRLTADEQYTHITLWSLLASPLLIGCDMSQMDAFTLSLLTNDEVLGINQDPLGRQATPVRQEPGIEIWSKPLEDGSVAVGLFCTGGKSPVESFNWGDGNTLTKIRINWTDLNMSGAHKVRDLWRQKDLGEFTDGFEAEVPFHGVVFVKISK
jgi:alpha-galactosidase